MRELDTLISEHILNILKWAWARLWGSLQLNGFT